MSKLIDTTETADQVIYSSRCQTEFDRLKKGRTLKASDKDSQIIEPDSFITVQIDIDDDLILRE